jgi:hypothetical protein
MNRFSPVSRRFAGTHDGAQKALGLGGAVAENGVHVDRRSFEHHAAGFSDGAFAGVQLDFYKLHLLAEDLEVDVVGDALRAGMLHDSGDVRDRAEGCHVVSPGNVDGLAAQKFASRTKSFLPAKQGGCLIWWQKPHECT